MTYPVTVYRWDDVGAPQFNTDTAAITANEIKAILTACLVNGYGSKASLGWTKPFDDANGVVYQNKVSAGGSGGMIRFWPASGNWSANITSAINTNGMYMQPAVSYSSSNVGSKVGQQGYFFHPENTIGAVKTWVLIGTAIGFYLFMQRYDATQTNASSAYKMSTAGAGYSIGFYVGDIFPTLVGDAAPFTLIYAANGLTAPTTPNVSDTLNGMNGIFTSYSPTVGVYLYDTDGGTGVQPHTLTFPFPASMAGNASPNLYDPLFMCPVVLMSAGFTITGVTQTGKQPYCRGIVPGYFSSMYANGGSSAYWPFIKSISGKNHWLVGNTTTTLSAKWVNMVEW